MTLNAAFSSRDCFEIPDNFGREPNMRWIPARNLDEAVRLSQAIDQRLPAVEVKRLLRRGRNSMTDLAKALSERPATL
jgi:hypothetical protein